MCLGVALFNLIRVSAGEVHRGEKEISNKNTLGYPSKLGVGYLFLKTPHT